MRAMVFHEPHAPLRMEQRSMPVPADAQVLIRVEACAVCRTDLHVQDGELPDIPYPVVPGHQVVGMVTDAGKTAPLRPGTRVGAAWLGWACGKCEFCGHGRENLCDTARFHGYQLDGGYADYMLADGRFCFPLDASMPAAETTPLLCAGLIGFRAFRMAGDAQRIGIYGFGSAAHIITQFAIRQDKKIYAFTSPGDDAAQAFARELGAVWAGGSDQPPPQRLDAALIFAPVGALVPTALRHLKKGGTVICGGIHMSDIPAFPYESLWGERQIRSVANLTRRDGKDFMKLAAQTRIDPRIVTYPLEEANRALEDLRQGQINGTAVLNVS
jgi:propanol-preferring alcohol dehydrogenase